MMELVQKTACGVNWHRPRRRLRRSPNGSELLSIYPENDIETYRDVLHFTGAGTGRVLRVNRAGKRNFGSGGDIGHGDSAEAPVFQQFF